MRGIENPDGSLVNVVGRWRGSGHHDSEPGPGMAKKGPQNPSGGLTEGRKWEVR